MARHFPLSAVIFSMALIAAGQAPALADQRLQRVQASAEAYTESQLEAYVAAVVRIYEIDRAWQPRIDGAETSGEAVVLTRQATEQMIAEVRAQGLSVDEYNAITQAAEADDRLYERIRVLLAAWRLKRGAVGAIS